MSISPLESVQSGNQTAAPPRNEVLGKDDFLNLLIAQLQHQDPLNPMEGTEFTAQLAQFSSLEQLNNINHNLETLQQSQADTGNTQAVAYIGKTVNVTGNSIFKQAGHLEEIHVDLPVNADEVLTYIYDAAGNFVRFLDHGPLGAGRYAFGWDGLGQEGNFLPDGEYRYETLASDSEGNPIAVTTFMTAEVSGITFKDGAAYAIAGGYEIPIKDIIEVHGHSATTQSN